MATLTLPFREQKCSQGHPIVLSLSEKLQFKTFTNNSSVFPLVVASQSQRWVTEIPNFSAISVQSFNCQWVRDKLDCELPVTCWLRCRNMVPSAAFWHQMVTSSRCQSTAGSAAIKNTPEPVCQM